MKARRVLFKAAHRHPEDPMVWLNLGLLDLHLYPDIDTKAAARCFSKALYLGRSSVDVSKVSNAIKNQLHSKGSESRFSLELEKV